MKTTTDRIELKRAGAPDDTRTFDKGCMEVYQFEPGVIGVIKLQPGWKWSECVKPLVGTSSCETPHLNYVITGRLLVKMDDGTEVEIGPGDIARIPPGHDAWVLGNEQFVALDYTGASKYALPNYE